MDTKEMLNVAENLSALKEQKSGLDEQIKALNTQIEGAENELSEMMTTCETPCFNHKGKLYYQVTKTRASAIAGLKDDLFNALKSNGHGSLVTETVNANSLSSFVKEFDGDVPKWLDELVNIFEKTTVNIKKGTR